MVVVWGGGKRARAGGENTSSFFSLNLFLPVASPFVSSLKFQFVMSLKNHSFFVENVCIFLFHLSVFVRSPLLSLARPRRLQAHFFSLFPLGSFFLRLFMLSTFARRLSSVPRSPLSSSLRAPASRQHFRSSVVAMASSSAFSFFVGELI